jgi:uncharacterized membrane protein YqjE
MFLVSSLVVGLPVLVVLTFWDTRRHARSSVPVVPVRRVQEVEV